MENEKGEELSLEHITEVIKSFFKEKEERGESLPFTKHYVWSDEAGDYSAWEVNTGEGSFLTGDGGIEMFNKAMKNTIYGTPGELDDTNSDFKKLFYGKE